MSRLLRDPAVAGEALYQLSYCDLTCGIAQLVRSTKEELLRQLRAKSVGMITNHPRSVN